MKAALLGVLAGAALILTDMLGRSDASPWLLVGYGALAPAAVLVAIADGRDR